jgi:phage-related protein (TIGR01555 family)
VNKRQRQKLKKELDNPDNRIVSDKSNKSNAALMMDMFTNAMARTGLASQNLMNATDYELTRITKNYQLLTTLYRENWIAKKIINTIPEDMCRNWFEITTEMDPKNLDRYRKLEKRTKIKSRILSAMFWSRLYGGSAAVMLISGQNNLSDPLDLDMIMPGSFKGLLVVDRWMGIQPMQELITDIDDPDYGLPEYYQITDRSTGHNIVIHHSRLIRFIGRELPYQEEVTENYWGASEMEHVFEELAKRDNTSWNIASLIFRASIIATKTDGLDVMLATGDIEAQKQFYETQQAINTMLNNNSMMHLGKDDEMQQLNYTFSGLNDVYESFMMDVAGAAEIPVTKLFGRSPAGMNSTGESDSKNYYETIENGQESELRPALEKLLPVMFMSEFGEVPADLDFRFLPVQSPTESEIADQVQKKTTAVKDAYDSGIINQRIALKELKAMSKSTGMFTHITDEDIENASTDFADETMLEGAMNEISGLANEQDTGGEIPTEPKADIKTIDRIGGWFKRLRRNKQIAA